MNRSSCLIVIAALWVGSAAADDAPKATDSSVSSNELPSYRDDRPDYARGWVILSRNEFWPLRFEPLKALERASESLLAKPTSADKDESVFIATAWMRLLDASSPTEQSNDTLYDAADMLEDMAAAAQNGTQPDASAVKQLLSNACIGIAKYHVAKATVAKKAASDAMLNAGPSPTASATEALKKVDREVQIENNLKRREQYRYDSKQISRHLDTAQVYLKKAVEWSGKTSSSTALTNEYTFDFDKADLLGIKERTLQLNEAIKETNSLIAELLDSK